MFVSTTSQIWSPQGTVLNGDPTTDETNLQEPSVLYEAGTFKLWCKGGWNTPHLNYYTSSDGMNWTPYGSNPLLSGTATEQPFVMKSGSTYYLYVHPALNAAFARYSSADGISWSLDNSTVLSLGTAGAWDDFQFGNLFVWIEGVNDWRMIYEARRSGGVWKTGYATSTDGLTWTKSGSNPVIAETGSLGGPWLYKNGTNDYWLWMHHSPSGVLPTDLERYKSSNLTTWTKDPLTNTLTRRSSDEGNDSGNGQIADPTLLELNGQVYMWFTGNADGSASTGHAHLKLAIARLPFSQLINTLEGY